MIMCECVRVEVHLVHLLLEGRGGEQGEVGKQENTV